MLLFNGGFLWFMCSNSYAQKRPVYVTASFQDKNSLFIENLDKNEVEIRENGHRRTIEFMAQEELPTVYGIIFDRSILPESDLGLRTELRAVSSATAARSISYELIDKYLGRQAVWVATYESDLQMATKSATDGFSAKNAIDQLRGRRQPADSFLYASLFGAVQYMNQRHEKRRVLILYIQDLDPETAGKMKPLKNLLSASNVELFVVAFTRKLTNRPGMLHSAMTVSAMKELARATSGDAFVATDYRDYYEDLVRRMHLHIRTFYTFGFEAESDDPGKLSIECTRPGSRVLCHSIVPAF